MREQIASLRTAAERARAVATTERAALPPPQQSPPRGGVAGDCGDVVGSTRHLLFDRLADDTDVDPFAGYACGDARTLFRHASEQYLPHGHPQSRHQHT